MKCKIGCHLGLAHNSRIKKSKFIFSSRGRSCTSHKAENWTTPPLYQAVGDDGSYERVNMSRTSPLTMMIYNMDHEALYVSNEVDKIRIAYHSDEVSLTHLMP